MRTGLSFRVTRDELTGTVVVPVVGRTPLTELVARFESRRGFTPAGGYAGLAPAADRLDELTRYYLGQRDGEWSGPGGTWLLGCTCGEPGCWPLEARIVVEPETVTWTGFAQPHRRERDYTGLGPFVFAREQYEDAARQVAAELWP